MVFTLNINNILLLVFHEVLLDKYFKKNLATCELWPNVPTLNFATKVSRFFSYSRRRDWNAKSHLDLSCLIREKLSVHFCFPLDCLHFISEVTSIHWTRVWDFYFIFHWIDFLVLVIKNDSSYLKISGMFVIVLLSKFFFNLTFYLPTIVIIKIKWRWAFLLNLVSLLNTLLKPILWSILIEKWAK